MYTIQYFIDKFDRIPWYKWCVNTQINILGQRCAYGHITPKEVKRCGNYPSNGVPEMEALDAIGNKYFYSDGDRGIANINNGCDLRFQQRTIKGRVIAALKWAQQQEAQEIINSCFEDKCFKPELKKLQTI